MNRLIRRIFENRGYTESFLYEINDPAYGRLQNMDVMVTRLREIHEAGLELTVFPDYDMDGIAAGTLGFSGFAELGFKVNLFVPDPEKGYGVHGDDIEELLFRFPNTKVIITCDTGIGATDAAKVCRERGVELLVTDHHIQDKELDASVIVDPMGIGESYAHPAICGAFVLYQVLQRYADLYSNYFIQDQIRRLRVFAGIGTISDSMPVLYENRQLVRDSVDICRMVYGDGSTSSVGSIEGCNTYRLVFWGLYNLMKAFADKGTISSAESVTEEFFGFYLAPMFNSIKRMGGDMQLAFGVFFASESVACVDTLYNLNLQRREQVPIELEAVKNRPQPYAPYIYLSDAREGILGLIATRLLEETGMPVFVLNDRGEDCGKKDRFHGSARIPAGYPMKTDMPDYTHCGGHGASFGIGIKNLDDMKQFEAFLAQAVAEAAKTAVAPEFIPDFIISTDWKHDTGIDVELFHEYLNEIDDYRPFGVGFETPVAMLRFRNQDVVGWRKIGKCSQHLKISLANGFDILCWNQGHLLSESQIDGWHQVHGKLTRSVYKGVLCVGFDGVLLPGVEQEGA